MNTILEVALDAALKSVFILALAGGAIICLPRAAAATRHMIWLLAIASLLVLPALSIVLPRWEILPQWPKGKLHPAESMAIQGAAAVAPPEGMPVAATVRTATPVAENIPPFRAARFDRSATALSIWSGGAVLTLLMMLLGQLSLWKLAQKSERVTGRNWLELLQRLMAGLHLKRGVLLIQSERRRMPMTWGLVRPKVLLPQEADEWPANRRRIVLLHELAHVKRRDYLAKVITQIVCALYWFNPLVWLAARRMVAERERACDDLVLSQGAEAADYAEQLLELAAESSRFAECGAMAMARPSSLEGRLLAILDSKRNRAGTSRVVTLMAVVVAAAVVGPAAMLRAATGKQPGFGPVIERTVYDPDTQKANSLLDLDSGKLFAEEVLPRDENTRSILTAIDTFLKMVRKEKIDLMGDASGHSMMGLDMVAAQVPNEQFEALTAEGLASDKRLAAAIQTETELTPTEIPATYIFKTREGGRGIMQIVRFNNHQNAEIRYKVATYENLNQENAGGFGSRVMMILSSRGRNRFLNLEDGKSYPEKPGNSGVAYLEQDAEGDWRLVIENIYNYPTKREQGIKLWETMTAEEIAKPAGLAAVPFERKGAYELNKTEMPVTVLIPQWGLLQIDGFDDRTTSVVLQYKRVAGADQGEDRPQPRRSLKQSDRVQRLRLQHAEQDLERVSQLYKQKLVSQHEFDQARLKVDVLRAELAGDAYAADRLRFEQAERDFKGAAEMRRANLMSEEEYQLFKQAFEIAQAEMESRTGEYTVRQGETLERIAEVNSVTAEALRRANPNTDWKRLQVGQKVIVPSVPSARRN